MLAGLRPRRSSAQPDRAGRAIDCLDRVEYYDQLASPQPSPPNHDLVRTVGVALVAHAIDEPELLSLGVEDSVAFGCSEQPSEFTQLAQPRLTALFHSWQAKPSPRRWEVRSAADERAAT